MEVIDEEYLDKFRAKTTEEQWEEQGFAIEVREMSD